MATKVYREGEYIVIDQNSTIIKFLVRYFRFFIYSESNTCILYNLVADQQYEDIIPNFQDGQGRVIGDYEVLNQYLQRISILETDGFGISSETKKEYRNASEMIADGHLVDADNRIVLKNYSYYFDSYSFDLEDYDGFYHDVTVHLFGYSQGINVLTSSKDNINLITSRANLFISNLVLEVTGTGSQCLEMEGTAGTPTESLDMNFVEFSGAYGTIKNIRQVFWVGGFSFGSPSGFLMR